MGAAGEWHDAAVTTSSAGTAPGSVDRAAIEHRLITMRKSVVQLDSLGRLDSARLANDPGTGLAVERVLALLNDLASAINRHVSEGVLGEAPPQTPTASFGAAERAGLIDAETAAALAPAGRTAPRPGAAVSGRGARGGRRGRVRRAVRIPGVRAAGHRLDQREHARPDGVKVQTAAATVRP